MSYRGHLQSNSLECVHARFVSADGHISGSNRFCFVYQLNWISNMTTVKDQSGHSIPDVNFVSLQTEH